jgi:phospholipid/cholesterol/gamma-HCH transport system ATP-binding protein
VSVNRESDRPFLEVSGLSVQFGSQPVLREIDLSIWRGETLAVIGESGCGKTVLLKTMVGLIRPTEGHVQFDGKRLDALSDKELTQQRGRFGYVFQNAALFDSMTIAENVAFPLHQNRGLSADEARETVVERLAEVGLPTSILEKKPAQLSGGMRKRVGLARALVMKPEVVMYDEPTTGLDPIMSDVINELIVSTRRRHPVTSVIVTHDMRTAQKTADRVMMMYPLERLREKEPQVIYDGPPNQIERCPDPRVTQFVRGEAGERLMEMRQQYGR